MSEEYDPEQEIGFAGDEDMPQDFGHHLLDAAAHHVGHGPHPGKYRGPSHEIRENEHQLDRPVPTEGDLARLAEEEGAPEELREQLAKSEGGQPTAATRSRTAARAIWRRQGREL